MHKKKKKLEDEGVRKIKYIFFNKILLKEGMCKLRIDSVKMSEKVKDFTYEWERAIEMEKVFLIAIE